MTLLVDDVSEPLRLSFTETKRRTLFLVDLSAVFWHAWHATNKDSSPDEAAEAAISRVRRWAREYPCIGVCCDDPHGNWRKDIYPEYKATRKEKPPGSREQLARAIEVLTAEGYPVWTLTNMEADDVIASAATDAANRGIDVIIAGADKDIAALICDRVSMLNERTNALMRVPEVRAKFGVRPEQIGDWLALVGDTADNIPGVPCIGEKSAAALLTRFGFIEQVIAAVKDPGVDISNEVRSYKAARKNLLDCEDRLGLTRQLVSLRRDLAVPIDEALDRKDVPANDAGPYVCPGCFAVGEKCYPGCDEEARIEAENDYQSDDEDEDYEDDGNTASPNVIGLAQPGQFPEAEAELNVFREMLANSPEVPEDVKEETKQMTTTESKPTTTNGAATQTPAPAARKVRNPAVKGVPKRPHAFVLTGRPNIGKTFLASTIPGRWFQCIEQGLEGASKEHVDDIGHFLNPPTRFGDLIADMRDFRIDQLKQGGFTHYVVDGMTGIERLVNKQACSQESVAHMGAKEFGQVWHAAIPLWQTVIDELELIRDAGAHVWVIAHSTETIESVGETGETWKKHDLLLQGTGRGVDALRNMWRSWADHVLFIDWDARVLKSKGKNAVGKYDTRIIRTRETPQHYAKNRANLPAMLPATWIDLQRALKAGSAGAGPAPDAKLRQQIETILPQVPDDGDREVLAAETKAAKSGAALSAILSRCQGLVAAARDDDAPEEQENEEATQQ